MERSDEKANGEDWDGGNRIGIHLWRKKALEKSQSGRKGGLGWRGTAGNQCRHAGMFSKLCFRMCAAIFNSDTRLPCYVQVSPAPSSTECPKV